MLSLEQLLEGVVVPIDKPRQWTSFQVVGKVRSVVRQLYGIKKFKIGHAGTLDPLATGLLLVCIGRATKQIEQLQQGDKLYSGTMVFGATTPCFDLERPIDAYYPYQHLSHEMLQQAASQFVGTTLQTPPIFSAVKVDGQRAYQIARQSATHPSASAISGTHPSAGATSAISTPASAEESGTSSETSQPQAKPVTIYDFKITAFRPGNSECQLPPIVQSPDQQQVGLYANPQGTVPEALPQADFEVHCGKGTYIRSIARDLGYALNSGSYLSSLRRQKIGQYNVSQAYKIEEIANFFDNKNP